MRDDEDIWGKRMGPESWSDKTTRAEQALCAAITEFAMRLGTTTLSCLHLHWKNDNIA